MFKQLLCYLWKHFFSVKIAVAAVLVLLWSFLYIKDYLTLSDQLGLVPNILEPAIYFIANNSLSAMVFTLCFVFVFCDSPFEDGSLPYFVFRSGYKRWYADLLAFSILFCVIYTLLPVVFSLILCAPKSYFSFELWSQTACLTAGGNAQTMQFLPRFPRELLLYQPGEALCIGFLLTFLHYLLIALTLLVFNSRFKKIWGTALVMIGEAGGYILVGSYPRIARFLPFTNAALVNLTFREAAKNRFSCFYVREALAYFGIGIVVLAVAGYVSIRHYRFELGEAK